MRIIRGFPLIWLLCGLFTSTTFVWAVDFPTAFQSGITAYQKQDYAAAQSAFRQALEARPEDPSTLVNLALTLYRDGKKGEALGYLRKTLNVSPGHAEAREAITFILREGQLRGIPHEIRFWETFRSRVLQEVSLPLLVFLTLFFGFWTAWSALSFAGARRRAILAETAAPSFPLAAVFSGLLFLTGLGIAMSKRIDLSQARGTVIRETVPALTAPTPESPSLFDLHEGLEVVVRQSREGWLQVTYPGGMTGWIPRDSLFITNPGDLE